MVLINTGDHDHFDWAGLVNCYTDIGFRKLEVLQKTAEEISQDTGNEVRP